MLRTCLHLRPSARTPERSVSALGRRRRFSRWIHDATDEGNWLAHSNGCGSFDDRRWRTILLAGGAALSRHKGDSFDLGIDIKTLRQPQQLP
jgi:hypothetical protein